jgi:phosphoribosylformylglycinamidine synthase
MESPRQSPARADRLLPALLLCAAADATVQRGPKSRTRKSLANRLIIEQPLNLTLRLLGRTKVTAGLVSGTFIIDSTMKAYVTVMLKNTVLDPQGKTIHGALKKMGYKGVDDVRQGKFFEIAMDGGLDKAAARTEVERIAKEVLTNPVIEEFSYRLED